jgi:hypothetical protein
MKTFAILIVCLFSLASVFGQKQAKVEIPAAAKSAFSAKFPKAADVKWSLEKKGEYEAEFKMNGSEVSAVFDEKGNLLETETEIKDSELPQAVKAAISKDLNGYKMEEIEKVVDAKGVTSYEAAGEKGEEKLEVKYDASGKLLEKKSEKEDKEDND